MKRIFLTVQLITVCLLACEPNAYSQEINILEKGADPKGLADVSQLLNRLVDSLSAAGGGTIIVPKGTYLLNDAIIMKSDITLKGKNWDESHFFRNPSSGNWKESKAQALITTDPSLSNENIEVCNLSLNGNYAKKITGGKGGVCLRNCRASAVRDVKTQNTWHGVAFYDFKGEDSGNVIEGVISENSHAFTSNNNSGRPRGILVTDAGSKILNSKSYHAGTGFYANGKNITLIGNHAESWFEDNGYYLIVDNLTVQNCSAKGGPSPEKGFGSGFAIAYKKGGIVENSSAINCSNYGFRIHVPESDLKLVNNQAIGCGNGFGIEVASHPFPEVSTNLLFQGNKAEYSGLHGFLFRQMTNSRVVDNEAINGNQRGVTLSTRGAIALKEYVSDSEFSNNRCTDNQSVSTQPYGLYDFSVNQLPAGPKRGENNKIRHKSSTGRDVFK